MIQFSIFKALRPLPATGSQSMMESVESKYNQEGEEKDSFPFSDFLDEMVDEDENLLRDESERHDSE
jgi:hypothetical protein